MFVYIIRVIGKYIINKIVLYIYMYIKVINKNWFVYLRKIIELMCKLFMWLI